MNLDQQVEKFAWDTRAVLPDNLAQWEGMNSIQRRQVARQLASDRVRESAAFPIREAALRAMDLGELLVMAEAVSVPAPESTAAAIRESGIPLAGDRPRKVKGDGGLRELAEAGIPTTAAPKLSKKEKKAAERTDRETVRLLREARVPIKGEPAGLPIPSDQDPPGGQQSTEPATGDSGAPDDDGGEAFLREAGIPVKLAEAYNADQPRDSDGKWTSGGGSGGSDSMAAQDLKSGATTSYLDEQVHGADFGDDELTEYGSNSAEKSANQGVDSGAFDTDLMDSNPDVESTGYGTGGPGSVDVFYHDGSVLHYSPDGGHTVT